MKAKHQALLTVYQLAFIQDVRLKAVKGMSHDFLAKVKQCALSHCMLLTWGTAHLSAMHQYCPLLVASCCKPTGCLPECSMLLMSPKTSRTCKSIADGLHTAQDWRAPSEFYGCGAFACDSWSIFCCGQTNPKGVQDRVLLRYLRWQATGSTTEPQHRPARPKRTPGDPACFLFGSMLGRGSKAAGDTCLAVFAAPICQLCCFGSSGRLASDAPWPVLGYLCHADIIPPYLKRAADRHYALRPQPGTRPECTYVCKSRWPRSWEQSMGLPKWPILSDCMYCWHYCEL